MKGRDIAAFFGAGKTLPFVIDTTQTSTEYGVYQTYDSTTGLFTIDTGYSATGLTNRRVGTDFAADASRTSGYIVINASKNPALTGANLYSSKTDIEVTTQTKGLVQTSPDGSRWRQGVSNAGATTWTKI